jgi:hypothetical protein
MLATLIRAGAHGRFFGGAGNLACHRSAEMARVLCFAGNSNRFLVAPPAGCVD